MKRKGPKRSRDEKKRDRSIIAKLYLKGLFQSDIPTRLQELTGDEYKLSQQQISYDLKIVRRYWMWSAVKAIDQRKNQELAKIDHLEQTYWGAWERSVDETTQKTNLSQISGGEQESPKRVSPSKNKNREVKSGDPRFLQGVQWCIQKRIQILGLDAPQRMVLEEKIENMGEKELEERLKKAEDVIFEVV